MRIKIVHDHISNSVEVDTMRLFGSKAVKDTAAAILKSGAILWPELRGCYIATKKLPEAKK